MKIDIVGLDATGRRILVVEVKTSAVAEVDAPRYFQALHESGPHVRFGMLADRSRIRIVDFESWDGRGFACVLNSSDMLSVYEPEFATKRIFHLYMTGLVNAWLTDFVYHWKHAKPPGSEELSTLGLAQLLEGGDTRREVESEADLVR